MHPALSEGRTAVITGAASGIGLAAAKAFARLGMKVCLADLPGEKLDRAAAEVTRRGGRPEGVRAIPTDVSQLEGVRRIKDEVYATFGEVALVMNNAGIGGGGGPWDNYDRWRPIDRGESMGGDQWRSNLRACHDRARNLRRHHQHWLQTGHHHASGRYGL